MPLLHRHFPVRSLRFYIIRDRNCPQTMRVSPNDVHLEYPLCKSVNQPIQGCKAPSMVSPTQPPTSHEATSLSPKLPVLPMSSPNCCRSWLPPSKSLCTELSILRMWQCYAKSVSAFGRKIFDFDWEYATVLAMSNIGQGVLPTTWNGPSFRFIMGLRIPCEARSKLR